MRLTNLERDILNPALASASTLNEASTVLNVFVLKIEWESMRILGEKIERRAKLNMSSNIAI
jgi:hypothetical protein